MRSAAFCHTEGRYVEWRNGVSFTMNYRISILFSRLSLCWMSLCFLLRRRVNYNPRKIYKISRVSRLYYCGFKVKETSSCWFKSNRIENSSSQGWRRNNQHNGTQHNDTQHNDAQYRMVLRWCYNMKHSIITFSIMTLFWTSSYWVSYYHYITTLNN